MKKIGMKLCMNDLCKIFGEQNNKIVDEKMKNIRMKLCVNEGYAEDNKKNQ